MRPELIRTTVDAGLTVLAAAGTGPESPRTLAGRIATYGQTVTPQGPWPRVRLAQGSLSPALSVKLLSNHDGPVIGSMNPDGFAVDGGGVVSASFRMAQTAAADEAASLIRDGHVDGLSVGYIVRDGREVMEDGEPIFEVTQADLIEVSVVPWPADTDARVSTISAREGRPMTTPTVTEPQDRGEVAVGPEAVRTADEISAAVQAALAQLAPQYAAPAIPPQHAHMVAAASDDRIRPDGYGRFLPGWTTRDGQRITAGDYMSALMRHRDGDGAAWSRISAAIEAENRVNAADQTTAPVPGLLPVQIIQPVIDTLSPIRPLFESLTARAMPSIGNKFQRPSIDKHVAVGEQTKELAAVASQAMEVKLDDVTKRTVAGSLRLSVQSIDWTTPALLDLVISDFAKVYAKWTEQDVSSVFYTNAKGTAVVGDPADPAALNAAFYNATATSWKAGGIMPNRTWLSLDSWAAIGAQVDGNKRPLYPFFGSAVNALGTLSPAGMLSGGGEVGSYRPVVAPYLPDGSIVVGPSDYYEIYEDRRGMLRVADPSALGQVIAWYGYIASYPAVPEAYVPITKAAPTAPTK